MTVPIIGGPGFAFGTPTVAAQGAYALTLPSLFGRTFDVSPDGRRFLMIKNEAADAQRIVVVLNGLRGRGGS
jgi:hypothetical protein